jgi:hypothetical protein
MENLKLQVAHKELKKLAKNKCIKINDTLFGNIILTKKNKKYSILMSNNQVFDESNDIKKVAHSLSNIL